jgi:4-amino-4-deoxy-L-arabinose transferase-like glycosyltransferase
MLPLILRPSKTAALPSTDEVAAENALLNPLRLQTSTALLLPAALVLLGHLTITGRLDLPVQLPGGLVDWLSETFRPDVAALGEKLSGLALVLAGGALFVLLARPQAPDSAARDDTGSQVAALTSRQFRIAGSIALLGVIIAGYAIVRFAGAAYSTPLVAVWLAGIGLVGAAFFYRDRVAGIDLRPHFDRVDIALVVALMLGAAFVLFYRLGSLPDSLWPDEGLFWLNARDIASGVWQPRLFEAGTYTFPVPSNYFQAAIIKLGGESLESWRAGSALAALLVVPPVYLLGRRLLSRPLAVAAVVLLVTSPHFLAFARLGYNNAQAIAPVVVAVYLCVVAVERRSLFLLFLAAATAGLGFYTYQAARLGLVIVVLLLAAGVLTRWLAPRFAATALGVVLLVAALIVLPLNLYLRETNPDAVVDKLAEGLYFEVFYGESQFSKEELAEPFGIATLGTHGNAQLFFNPELHARLIGRGAVRTALAFDDASLVRWHFIPGSLGGPAGSLLLVTGFATALAAWRRPSALLLVVWAVAGLLAFSVLSAFPPQWTRLLPALPAFALLSSLGLATLLRPLTTRVAAQLQPAVFSAAVATVAVFGLHDYFVETPKLFQPSLPDVIGFEAREPDAPSQFIAVYETQLSLAEPPFLLKEFPTSVRYASLPAPAEIGLLDGLLAGAGRDFALFYDAASAQVALSVARQRYGEGEVREYRNAAGRVIGGSYRPSAPAGDRR